MAIAQNEADAIEKKFLDAFDAAEGVALKENNYSVFETYFRLSEEISGVHSKCRVKSSL